MCWMRWMRMCGIVGSWMCISVMSNGGIIVVVRCGACCAFCPKRTTGATVMAYSKSRIWGSSQETDG